MNNYTMLYVKAFLFFAVFTMSYKALAYEGSHNYGQCKNSLYDRCADSASALEVTTPRYIPGLGFRKFSPVSAFEYDSYNFYKYYVRNYWRHYHYYNKNRYGR